MDTSKQLVVKFGTEVLMGKVWNGKQRLSRQVFSNAASQIARLQASNIGMTVVTSGAIQAGRESILKLENNIIRLESILSKKKELAGIGARHLLDMWGRGFARQNREVAQLWVTFENLSNEGELESIRSSILNYQNLNIIPIVNENDVVSDSEIKSMEAGLSENDRLARMIAQLLGADSILFVTKCGGVYDKNPTEYPDAKIYSEIDVKTAIEIINNVTIANASASTSGAGGIVAKLQEALLCLDAGMRVAIAGMNEDTIYKFAIGEPQGTMVVKSLSSPSEVINTDSEKTLILE
ncbi:MAG: hypothetical protein Q8L47_03295 [bacterium]|nr:hypothetical protein [bacterium]